MSKIVKNSPQKSSKYRCLSSCAGIVIPTFKQMKNPETLPEKIKKN